MIYLYFLQKMFYRLAIICNDEQILVMIYLYIVQEKLQLLAIIANEFPLFSSQNVL